MLLFSIIINRFKKNYKVLSYQKKKMKTTITQKTKQKNCQFIDKLLDMIEKYPNYIYWTQNQDELIIGQLQKFETQVLPDYFRHQNFASFVRQLNMYGFCKKEKSEEFLRFTHQIFKKYNTHNFHLIQRKAKIRNLKNSSTKFLESNNKIIQTIKTKSGLTNQAQELTINLLQYKQNIQDTTKKIKFQLDKLFMQFKDVRSKNVVQTLDMIKKQSYSSILSSLSKGKHIEQLLFQQFKNQKRQSENDHDLQHFQDDDAQCSLQQNLQICHDDNHANSQNQISQRFQMQQDQLSAFNQFQQQQKQ